MKAISRTDVAAADYPCAECGARIGRGGDSAGVALVAAAICVPCVRRLLILLGLRFGS